MKFKAEMWDKMQEIMSRYNDHMTHCYMTFEKELNEKAIKRAFQIAIDNVPVLKCKYKNLPFGASWKEIKNFNIDDVFTFKTTSRDLLEESEEFLLDIIDETKEAQIKILLLRKDKKDALSCVINHQIMDGADLKIFYSYVSEIYTDIIKGGSGDIKTKCGTRSDLQIYKGFTDAQKKEIKELISYSKKQKHQITFEYEDNREKDVFPKINKLIYGSEKFKQMKLNAKKLGVSLNDVILASFYRASFKLINIPEGQTLGIPNMVNLRRYIESGESEGYCNLTSMMVCNLGENIGDDMLETAAKCNRNMDAMKKGYPGLDGLALLKFAFTFPHFLARFLIGTFFKNPLIGISNIGIVDEKTLCFAGSQPEYLYMTGSVKYPPYMQLALTTFKNAITFTIANYGTENDHKMFNNLLSEIEGELNSFTNTNITSEVSERVWNRV